MQRKSFPQRKSANKGESLSQEVTSMRTKQQSKKIIQVRHLQKLRKEHWHKGHLERSVAIATPISFQREGCLKVLWECRGCRLGMLMSIVGKDDEIYCKSCYARKFGAPGYRGAGCGDWTDAKVLSFYPKKKENLVSMLTCFSQQRRCVQTLLLMCLRSRGMRRTHRPASGARWTHTLTSYLLFFPPG